MESTSATDEAPRSNTLLIKIEDEKQNDASINSLLLTPELSTPTSNLTVKTTVSEFSEEYEKKPVSTDPENASSSILSVKNKAAGKDSVISETGYISDDDDDDLSDVEEPLLAAKDSRLLLVRRSSTDERVNSVENKVPEPKGDKKKISFSDSEEIATETIAISEENRNANINIDHLMPASQANNGRALGRILLEGSNEPMRCWMTEGDHPNHPAGSNICTNIKVISNRPKDSADSILRDTDDFIFSEKKITRQISWPKKVSISDEPPTTFIRDIPPAENPDIEPDSDQPATKMKTEAELAAAAAAALKEDWRKKADLETVDLDEDDKIIFGDGNVKEESPILQISDDEASDIVQKEDVK